MLHKLVGTTFVCQTSETHLCHDGSKLAASSRDTVSGRTVTSREHLSGNDESGGIGPEILEEIGETIEYHEAFDRLGSRGKSCVAETYSRGSANRR